MSETKPLSERYGLIDAPSALEVDCPRCGSAPGERCRRYGITPAVFIDRLHNDRIFRLVSQKAMQASLVASKRSDGDDG